MAITYGGTDLTALGFRELMSHEYPCATRNVEATSIPYRMRGGYDVDGASHYDVELVYEGKLQADDIHEALRLLRNAIVRGERLVLSDSKDPLWYRVARGTSVAASRLAQTRCDCQLVFTCDAYQRLVSGDEPVPMDVSGDVATATTSNYYQPCQPLVTFTASNTESVVNLGNGEVSITTVSGSEYTVDFEALTVTCGDDVSVLDCEIESCFVSSAKTATVTNASAATIAWRQVSL